MHTSFALILAGGGGTRLWPASRRARPKQLLTLGGSETLLAATFRRAAALVGREQVLVVTAADQADAVRAALPELPAENLVAEPAARNTAAAVGLGAVVAARRAGREARLAVLPADAHIGDEPGFLAAARTALAHAHEAIVVIGIKPTHPETGYGYIRPGKQRAPGVVELAAFVEKPNLETARTYLADGYLWNAGMFFFSAGILFDEANRHMPELGRALGELVAAPDFAAATAAIYPSVPATSIDYGIAEKASHLLAVPANFGWNDVGSWSALPTIRQTDADGNVVAGDAVVVRAHGSVVLSEPGAPLVAVSEVDDLVVVATRDAVLVTRRDRAQSVRAVVDALVARGRKDLL